MTPNRFSPRKTHKDITKQLEKHTHHTTPQVLYLPAVLTLAILWTGGLFELVPASRGLNPLLTLLSQIACG